MRGLAVELLWQDDGQWWPATITQANALVPRMSFMIHFLPGFVIGKWVTTLELCWHLKSSSLSRTYLLLCRYAQGIQI